MTGYARRQAGRPPIVLGEMMSAGALVEFDVPASGASLRPSESPDGAWRTAALNTPSVARPAPVAAMAVAAADGWSMASAKAIGGHHNRARSGAGMVHSPGSGTMPVGYPLPVASLDAVTVHRRDDVSAVGGGA